MIKTIENNRNQWNIIDKYIVGRDRLNIEIREGI